MKTCKCSRCGHDFEAPYDSDKRKCDSCIRASRADSMRHAQSFRNSVGQKTRVLDAPNVKFVAVDRDVVKDFLEQDEAEAFIGYVVSRVAFMDGLSHGFYPTGCVVEAAGDRRTIKGRGFVA